MVASYQGFFRLPSLHFVLAVWSAAAGVAISFMAAFLGVVTAVRKIAGIPPAVAMHPAAPAGGGRTLIESLGIVARLRASRMIVLRNLAGHPLRTAFSVAGIALAVPMVVLGLFWRDAIAQMIDLQFARVERGNVTVAFSHPLDRRVMVELARLPGVLVAEGERVVPARLRAGQRSHLTSIVGLAPANELRRPHDAHLRPIEVSPEGVTLTERLADRLGVGLGTLIRIEVMEGRQLKRDLPVTAIVKETIGMGAYMEIGSIDDLTGEGDVVSAASLFVEPGALGASLRRLKELPVVESASVKSLVLASFVDKVANLVLVSAGILTGFAAIIAGGIVYNGARIGLQERARELASLRVLGFTRAEVARILFGEFFVEILAALPIGMALSSGTVDLIVRLHANESFQIPAVVNPRTVIAAAGIVLVAALASAAVVRRRIDHLDLVAVLKTRE
jgi:putative ABC transport system permease protein